MYIMSYSSLNRSQLLELNQALKHFKVQMSEAKVRSTEVGYFVTIEMTQDEVIQVNTKIPSIPTYKILTQTKS
tara:strand:+ start:675 stop:893 length:219 start_codon:yes stop_codon:yes gene_type:complete